MSKEYHINTDAIKNELSHLIFLWMRCIKLDAVLENASEARYPHLINSKPFIDQVKSNPNGTYTFTVSFYRGTTVIARLTFCTEEPSGLQVIEEQNG